MNEIPYIPPFFIPAAWFMVGVCFFALFRTLLRAYNFFIQKPKHDGNRKIFKLIAANYLSAGFLQIMLLNWGAGILLVYDFDLWLISMYYTTIALILSDFTNGLLYRAMRGG